VTTIQLPGELVAFLGVLGIVWQDADEDKLHQLGQLWSDFATTQRNLVSEADGYARAVWTANEGVTADAFRTSWTGESAPSANLRDAADAADMIAAGLHAAAAIVVALKLKVIAEVTFFARVCWVAAQAAKTPWTAVLAVAGVVAARIATVMAIDAAIEAAMKALLDEPGQGAAK